MTGYNGLPSSFPIVNPVGQAISFQIAATDRLGAAVDLTGATAYAPLVGEGLSAVTALDTAILGNTLTVSLSEADSTSLGEGRWHWYLEVSKDGIPRRWIAGPFITDDSDARDISPLMFNTEFRALLGTDVVYGLTVLSVGGGGGGDADVHIADPSNAHEASAVSIVDAEDHFGIETDVEGALEVAGAGLDSLDTRVALLEAASTTFDPLEQEGIVLHLIYNDTNNRFEYPGNTTTAPVLTGRVCAIEWEATSANVPAQGTGASDFRPGDKAIVRATEYGS